MTGRFLAFGACLALSLGIAADSGAKGADAGRAVHGGGFAVRSVMDLDYYTGPDADAKKHKLDLYLPQGASQFPVVFFVHGGGWTRGDKQFPYLDIYGKLGALLAKNGVGLVVANYRLSPDVQHPEHIKDVARAFAWTHKHLGGYGANVEQMFVAGHSAGGHLVALLATDARRLGEHNISPKAIRGVIGISGVYEIDPSHPFYSGPFGDDAAKRHDASPIHHVKAELPPFLLLYGDKDLPTLDLLAVQFHKALKNAKVDSELMEMKKRDHFGILGHMLEQEDPALQAMLKFLARHSSLELKPN